MNSPSKQSESIHDLLWLVILMLGTLVLLALVIRICGQDPVAALGALWRGAFGSTNALAATASRAVVLIFYALGIVASFRAGLLNIGAEGQSRVGAALAAALGTGAVGLQMSNLGPLGILMLLVAGATAGACWSLIAGALRQWRGVPEVISTLMLNFAALLLVRYLVSSPELLRGASIFQQSDLLPQGLQFSGWGRTEFNAGIFFAVPIVLVFHGLLFHTPFGFALRASGLNPVAAKTNGIAVSRLQLQTFAIAGALAGFAGALSLLTRWRLDADPAYPDYGYMAIAVALVANLKPLQVLPSAILFAGLEVGAKSMQGSAGVSHWVVYLVEGVIILAILIRGVQVFRKKGEPATAAEAAA